MLKQEKERVVADLVERLRASDTLIVADYRGLTMPEIDGGFSASTRASLIFAPI